jgi:RNA polymerase sigma-70 factor (ECF subfamily)
MGTADAARVRRFDELYHAHHNAVLAYCLRRAEWADAYDVTAEVFIIVWRRFDELPNDDDLGRWLYGVAAKVLANHRRGLRRMSRLVRRIGGLPAGFDPGPEVPVVRNAEHTEVIQALGRLRPADQEVLRLYAWEDLSHRAIADILGTTEAAIGQRIHRAYQRLGKQLTRSRGLQDRATTLLPTMTPLPTEKGGEQ